MADDEFPSLGAQPPQTKKKGKKNQKVSLDAFLADTTTGGSWADEMDSLPTAPMARETGAVSGAGGWGARRNDGGFGDRSSGYGADSYSDRPQRAEVPLPTVAPFIAYVGNLSFEATEADITDLFATIAENITSIRLVMGHDGRSKGLAYVEFKTLDDLKSALQLTGTSMGGRSVRVSVAEPRRGGSDDRAEGEWRSGGPLKFDPAESRDRRGGYERTPSSDVTDWSSARGGRFAPTEEPAAFVRRNFSAASSRNASFGNLGQSESDEGLERGGFGSKFTPSEDSRRSSMAAAPVGEADTASTWRRAAPVIATPTPSSPGSAAGSQRSDNVSHPPSPAVTRRKLELAPRSKPSDSETPASPSLSASSSKPNPFGNAKPVDTAEKERQLDEKRAQKAPEKEPEQTSKVILVRGDPFGAAKPVDTTARLEAMEAKIQAERSNIQARNANARSPPGSPKHSRQSSVSKEREPVKTSAYATKALRKEGFSFASAAGGRAGAEKPAEISTKEDSDAPSKEKSVSESKSVDAAAAGVEKLEVSEKETTDTATDDKKAEPTKDDE